MDTKAIKAQGYLFLWGFEVPLGHLNDFEINYLRNLPQNLPTVQWIWEEMDRIWDSFGLDNKKDLSSQRVYDFYSHPVWILNGIFSACDPISHIQRQSIAKYLVSKGFKKIADYGGGFGELALTLTSLSRDIRVEVIEPFPSAIGSARIEDQVGVCVMRELSNRQYDAIIAQDVLEHVEDPVGLSIELSRALKDGGLIVFANCFYPVIKCHLPRTFHLRLTFKYVMNRLGLEYVGCVPQAEHALVFEKRQRLDIHSARRTETLFKIFGPVLNLLWGLASRARKAIIT